MEQERRRIFTPILPPILEDPLQITTSEDEMQKWIDEKYVQHINVYKILYFKFILVGTKVVGDKIRDTPTNESQQEDWTQMPPESQGPKLPPPSPLQTIVVDKGSTTPLPPNTDKEQVQKRQKEEP